MTDGRQCAACARQWPGRLACEAYPDGIPLDVIENRRLHLQVLDDQTGTATWKGDGRQPEYVPAPRGENGGR